MNYFWFSAPYRAVPVRVPDQFPLTIGVVVEKDAECSEKENHGRERKSQVVGMASEVECVAGVDRGDPDHTPPTLGGEGEGEEGEGEEGGRW